MKRLLGAALTATLLAGTASAETIRFWTTEEQPDRLAKQQALAEALEASSGIAV
jgi:multiple sugar transport system substrate-binding protein